VTVGERASSRAAEKDVPPKLPPQQGGREKSLKKERRLERFSRKKAAILLGEKKDLVLFH